MKHTKTFAQTEIFKLDALIAKGKEAANNDEGGP